MWDAPSGAWTREIPDHGTQGVAVPAVLSRALPVVGNSESESPRYATLNGRPSSGQMRRASGLGDMLAGRALWTVLDWARARFSFAVRRPPGTRDAPEFHAIGGGTRSTPVSSILNEKPVPCSTTEGLFGMTPGLPHGDRARAITDHGRDARLDVIYAQVRVACTNGIVPWSVITTGYLPTTGLVACPVLQFCPARCLWSVTRAGQVPGQGAKAVVPAHTRA